MDETQERVNKIRAFLSQRWVTSLALWVVALGLVILLIYVVKNVEYMKTVNPCQLCEELTSKRCYTF